MARKNPRPRCTFELLGDSAGTWHFEVSDGGWTVTGPEGTTTATGAFDDVVAEHLPSPVREGVPLVVTHQGLDDEVVLDVLTSSVRFAFDVEAAKACDERFLAVLDLEGLVGAGPDAVFDGTQVEVAAVLFNGDPCVAVWPPDGTDGSVALVPWSSFGGCVEVGTLLGSEAFDANGDPAGDDLENPYVVEESSCGSRAVVMCDGDVGEMGRYQVFWRDPAARP